MSEEKHTALPKLVMGYLEVITGEDMEVGIPYDEAVIHIEGDEESEIEIHCPGALRLAPLIIEAVNNNDRLTERCEAYKNQVNAGSDEIDALKAKLEYIADFVEFWIYDGRLQTFEDLKRFRKAARAVLKGEQK